MRVFALRKSAFTHHFTHNRIRNRFLTHKYTPDRLTLVGGFLCLFYVVHKELLHPVCAGALHFLAGVDVPLQGKCCCCVAEICLYCFQIIAVHKSKGCVCMSQIVYAQLRQTDTQPLFSYSSPKACDSLSGSQVHL